MVDRERDDFPMLGDHVELARRTTRSASLSIPANTYYDSEDTFVAHTGPLPMHSYARMEKDPFHTVGNQRNKPHAITPEEYNHSNFPYNKSSTKNGHLMMSGALGACDNPDCTDCPAYLTRKRYPRNSSLFGSKLHNISYRKSGGWIKKILNKYFPIMNPHTKVIQNWNKFFVISCLVAIFIDPLFFFVLRVIEGFKCISFDSHLAIIIAVVRSVTDFIYLLHMLLQFRLAYVAPESRVVGAGDLVDQPRKIALNYLKCNFWIDLFVVFPLPQVLILAIIPHYVGASEANYAKNLLRFAILVQYIPRILRFLPLVAGQSANGFIFESAWANFVINLLMFVLAGHVVGACWYLFGLQRVNQCLHDVCSSSQIKDCTRFLDCGYGKGDSSTVLYLQWLNDSSSTDCLNGSGGFSYGIYEQAVQLTTVRSFIKRYIYALFWGFQQISTLAGNLVPSYFVWEVLFTMAIVGLGLLLFALLIGNMQNFLLALGRRKLEMQLRRRDVEKWMSHRRLPAELRRKVRQAERVSWVATQGVNEEELIENLPEDLQREIRRHFFKFLNKVRLFTLMDEPTLDAVCEKLRQKFYIKGSDILYYGGPLEKMIFIVRGKAESIGVDGNKDLLAEGDVCGEELLTWFLEQTSVNRERQKVRFPGQRLYSTRTVKCLSNVEAFVLRASDLEDMTTFFLRFLRSPRVQGAIRYESPYWRTRAATLIQVAWRYRQKRLKRAETSHSSSNRSYLS